MLSVPHCNEAYDTSIKFDGLHLVTFTDSASSTAEQRVKKK